jgi:hypothetical protein
MARAEPSSRIVELLEKLIKLAEDTGKKVDVLHDVEVRNAEELARVEAARVKKAREDAEAWRKRQAQRRAQDEKDEAEAARRSEEAAAEAARVKEAVDKEEAMRWGVY